VNGLRFIAGSGRSGTTWVLDSMATANDLRPVFEPFHPYISPVGDRYAHRALAPEEENEELKQFLWKVCDGKSHRLWTQYRRQIRWLFPPPNNFGTRKDAGRTWRHWAKFITEIPRLTLEARRKEPIVKCIRANLMLGWLSRRCGCRVVLIVRHPGAVIESELRGSWNAQFALDRFRNDGKLHEMTNGRYVKLLAQPMTQTEALAVRWLVENQWVVERADADGITVIYYEELRSSPAEGWRRIGDALGLELLPDTGTLSRPSQQSSTRRTGDDGGGSVKNRWQRALTGEQIDEIQRMLDRAECSLYSMNDLAPRLTVGLPARAIAGSESR